MATAERNKIRGTFRGGASRRFGASRRGGASRRFGASRRGGASRRFGPSQLLRRFLASSVSFSMLASVALAWTPAKAAAEAHAHASSAWTLGFEELNRFKCDKAILYFSKDMRSAGRVCTNPDQAARRIAKDLVMVGKAFDFDENFAAAVHCFRMALVLDPELVCARAYLAIDLLRTNEITEAREELVLLKKVSQPNVYAAMALSNEQRLLGNYASALKILSSSQFDQNPSLLRSRGVVLNLLGFSNRAHECMTLAAKYASNEYVSHLLLATAAALATDAPLQQLELRRAGSALPDDPMWMTRFADLSDTSADERLGYLQRAVNTPRACQRAYLMLAATLSKKDDTEGAFESLGHIERMQPCSTDIKIGEARLLWRTHNTAKSEALLKSVIKDNRYAADAYVDLARHCEREFKLKDAARYLEQALKVMPFNRALQMRLADVYWKGDDKEQASSSYAAIAKQVEPELSERNALIQADYARCHARMGTLWYQKKNMENAEREAADWNDYKFSPTLPPYLTWVKISPGRIDLKMIPQVEQDGFKHALLADMLKEGNDFTDSINEYQKAVELCPDSMELHSYLLAAISDSGDNVAAAKENIAFSAKLVNKAPQTVGKFIQKKLDSLPLPKGI